METDQIAVIASSILKKSHQAQEILSVMPLSGGANNRVFKIEGIAACYLFKSYYHDMNDPKDRAATDFHFCTFTWNHGLHIVPRPLGLSAQHHAALYEFIEGRRLTRSEITPSTIDQAIDFFIQINQHPTKSEAINLPKASEACFSDQEHFLCIQKRINKLQLVEENQALGTEAKQLIHDQICPQWKTLTESTDLTDTELLSQEERCLSPSDFGFHNALLQDDGTLRFFDFEHAGWDDPAKMICDFFCQPELPAPESTFTKFCSLTTEKFPLPEKIILRAKKLLPFYRIKWCCILLNEFLSHNAARRHFALTSVSELERKKQQLRKVKDMLAFFEK